MGSNTTGTAEQGILFSRNSKGLRSTTASAKAILAAALGALGDGKERAALAERKWRTNYPTYFRNLVEGALLKPGQAVASAKAGLDAALRQLQWTSEGKEESLAELVRELTTRDAAAADKSYSTLSLKGKCLNDTAPSLSIPYQGTMLRGSALLEQVSLWLKNGAIEESAAKAIRLCVANPQWFDLSDRTLVILGAGSEAGPLRLLSQWRANIVAVDLARKPVWERIARLAEEGNSTIHVPFRMDAADSIHNWTARAGGDLLTELPQIAAWIRSFEGPLDVAAHCYADGERHVRLAAAMDVIQAIACHDHKDSTLAFMATPTDVYAVPSAPAMASMKNFKQRPLLSKLLQRMLALVSGGRFFLPNVKELLSTPGNGEYAVVDSLVIQQGPNYALAKRMQQWRSLVARAAGHTVSINVAPPTETASVLSNKPIAAGYKAADIFGVEVFKPETTTALMAALWVHDLRQGSMNKNSVQSVQHPLELIAQGACHGGFWRVSYLPRTALPFVAVIGWLRGIFS